MGLILCQRSTMFILFLIFSNPCRVSSNLCTCTLWYLDSNLYELTACIHTHIDLTYSHQKKFDTSWIIVERLGASCRHIFCPLSFLPSTARVGPMDSDTLYHILTQENEKPSGQNMSTGSPQPMDYKLNVTSLFFSCMGFIGLIWNIFS